MRLIKTFMQAQFTLCQRISSEQVMKPQIKSLMLARILSAAVKFVRSANLSASDRCRLSFAMCLEQSLCPPE